MEKVKCACGCGTIIEKYDNRGRERRYVKTHISRGRKQSEETKKKIKQKLIKKWKSGALESLRETIRKIHTKHGNSGRLYRQNAYKFYGTKCQKCGKRKETEIHHILPLRLGGSSQVENLMVLCKKCHKEAERFNYKQARELYFKQFDIKRWKCSFLSQ